MSYLPCCEYRRKVLRTRLISAVGLKVVYAVARVGYDMAYWERNAGRMIACRAGDRVEY